MMAHSPTTINNMSKSKDLHLDITHDAPITGSHSFLDTTIITFLDDDNAGMPLKVTEYKIIGGELIVWLSRREDCSSEPITVLDMDYLSEHNCKADKTTMLKLKQKINYKGHEYQVVDIENVTQPLSVGEDEILYHLCNRHGDVIQVMDWELVNDRKGTRKLTPLILIGLLHGAIFLVYGHVVWLITSSTFFVA
jgi:hypothetical protein